MDAARAWVLCPSPSLRTAYIQGLHHDSIMSASPLAVARSPLSSFPFYHSPRILDMLPAHMLMHLT